MAERSRTRRNTLERRCLGKAYKRLFVGSQKGIFKMLEKNKKEYPPTLPARARRSDARGRQRGPLLLPPRDAHLVRVC
jgi:hypothetical protein